MATTKGMTLKNGSNVAAPKQQSALGMMISSGSVQERFNKMLGDKAPGFLSSLLSLVNNNDLLVKANPKSILAGAATAAALDLPINPSLGMAWLVPYGNDAQFQLGYKGVIALAQRTGLMKSIVMTPVYEGEIRNWNRFTENYEQGERTSDAIVGFFARFELVNGFSKATYWTKAEVDAHAIKFNPMCKSKGKLCGNWVKNYEAMACKTVLMSIMKTYCPMSIEMQKAFVADGKVVKDIKDDGSLDTIDVETEESNINADISVEPIEPMGANFVEDPMEEVPAELFKEQ